MLVASSIPVIGLSANDIESHDAWTKDIEEISKTFVCPTTALLHVPPDLTRNPMCLTRSSVKFPIIGDKDRSVATAYDMLDGSTHPFVNVRQAHD